MMKRYLQKSEAFQKMELGEVVRAHEMRVSSRQTVLQVREGNFS